MILIPALCVLTAGQPAALEKNWETDLRQRADGQGWYLPPTPTLEVIPPLASAPSTQAVPSGVRVASDPRRYVVDKKGRIRAMTPEEDIAATARELGDLRVSDAALQLGINGFLAEGRHALEQILRKNPNSAFAPQALSDLLLMEGDSHKAMQVLVRTAGDRPGADVKAKLALAAALRGKPFPHQHEYYERQLYAKRAAVGFGGPVTTVANADVAERVIAYFAYATDSYFQSEDPRARWAWSQALRLDPDNAWAHYSLGMSFSASREWFSAKRELSIAADKGDEVLNRWVREALETVNMRIYAYERASQR